MAKILLVEDDKALREIYGVRLLAEGYDIVSASDGEEAIVMAKKEQPDLILSDVMMPRVSGFDMLDILKSTPETQNVKVIIMTALSSDEQREKGESLGADLYLVKSQVGIEDVVRSVKEVLEGKLPSVEENNIFSGPDVADAWANKTPTEADPTDAGLAAPTETTESTDETIELIETTTADKSTTTTPEITSAEPTPAIDQPEPLAEPALEPASIAEEPAHSAHSSTLPGAMESLTAAESTMDQASAEAPVESAPDPTQLIDALSAPEPTPLAPIESPMPEPTLDAPAPSPVTEPEPALSHDPISRSVNYDRSANYYEATSRDKPNIQPPDRPAAEPPANDINAELTKALAELDQPTDNTVQPQANNDAPQS